MRVAKYKCPQCGASLECMEAKILNDDVCTSCGFIFMPGKCPGLEIVDAVDSMPPLPDVAPPPRKRKRPVTPPPRRITTQRRVSAPPVQAPTELAKPTPVRKNSVGDFGSVVLSTVLLASPFLLLTIVPFLYSMHPAALINPVLFLLAFPIPALIVAKIAHGKTRQYWYWWMACWFLPVANLIIFIAVLVVEPLSICGSCGMRIPKDSAICRYCGK